VDVMSKDGENGLMRDQGKKRVRGGEKRKNNDYITPSVKAKKDTSREGGNPRARGDQGKKPCLAEGTRGRKNDFKEGFYAQSREKRLQPWRTVGERGETKKKRIEDGRSKRHQRKDRENRNRKRADRGKGESETILYGVKDVWTGQELKDYRENKCGCREGVVFRWVSRGGVANSGG